MEGKMEGMMARDRGGTGRERGRERNPHARMQI